MAGSARGSGGTAASSAGETSDPEQDEIEPVEQSEVISAPVVVDPQPFGFAG
jgi:hypothetical protein